MRLEVKNTVFQKGRPQVAVSITGETLSEIVEQAREIASESVQVIEWRADYYFATMDNIGEALKSADTYLEIMNILEGISQEAPELPLIFTIRTKGQGGQIDLSNEQIEGIQSFVADSSLVDFIDVEVKGYKKEFGGIGGKRLENRVSMIHEKGKKIILSYHDFEEMIPSKDTAKLVAFMAKNGGDMFKVAAMANDDNDAKEMLEATAFLSKKGIGPLITMAMGNAGVITRIIGGKYGSVITFAAVGENSAPGQISAGRMKTELDRFYGA